MVNVVEIDMRVEGMLLVLEIEYDDGSIKVLQQTSVPPPCESCNALTRADITDMIEAHSCSGVA